MKKTTPEPAMQGEGNYSAARRHRKSVQKFVQSGQVQKAAQSASPKTAEEARELLDAEQAGLAPARQ